jgi:YVTN family beta-propeller protein
MKTVASSLLRGALIGAVFFVHPGAVSARPVDDYQVFVSNERGGDLTVINGNDLKVAATIPVGKRPRGLHASPDGKTVYVALSGTPISAPPQLDARGNPILQKGGDDDDDNAKAADGIGVVDVAQRKFLRKIPAGSPLRRQRPFRRRFRGGPGGGKGNRPREIARQPVGDCHCSIFTLKLPVRSRGGAVVPSARRRRPHARARVLPGN